MGFIKAAKTQRIKEERKENDAPSRLVIEYYWSQKGVNWLSGSTRRACRENMLNWNSDWPHGCVDAAIIIAFAWCFSPHFQHLLWHSLWLRGGAGDSFPVMQMVFVARIHPPPCPLPRLSIWEQFPSHQCKQQLRRRGWSPRTDGFESREWAAVLLTTLAGQDGICYKERGRGEETKERERVMIRT